VRRKAIVIGVVAILAAATAFGIRALIANRVANRVQDEEPDHEVTPSTGLERDKERMWRLVELKTRDDTGDVTYLVSPVSAINAASRVIEAEKANLIGLTPKEVLQRLNHDEGHRRGSYNFPFYPLAKDERAMVLRFDCGAFGWQFDLLLDEQDKVREVRRNWIE
jgi:hypothetical protein